jgi:hypothetical protein
MIRSAQGWQIAVSIPAATGSQTPSWRGRLQGKSERLFGGDLARAYRHPPWPKPN